MTTKKPTKNDPVDLPEPGPGKQDPKELDKQLDRALEDTMEASDPPATTQPDVHIRHHGKQDDKTPPTRKPQ
ncbi:MAG: hypothetical protein GEV05_15050 [Betaproteobacteria bacterium]|nr:hypothetical protein [Betaproteobacteria bacterium]